MKKGKTSVGWIYYKTTTEEIFRLGGRGICDECNEFQRDGGYLIPVLNHWQCEKCFNKWQEYAHYYPEDEAVEQQYAKYYESILPLT